MWKVFVFASLLGSGSLVVDVLLSGTGLRAGSGTMLSATLEMGSRAIVSVTEAKPREKTAGRRAGSWRSAVLNGACSWYTGSAYLSAW